jgi:hypothetical protein
MRLVQLMGGTPTQIACPPRPEGAHRWGLNNLYRAAMVYQRFQGWTEWFDLHSTEHIQGRRIKGYGWLCQQTKPIYRWVVDPAMPSSVAYPATPVRAAFGGTRLFCSTLDWMLALAIYQEFERIELFGWRMSHPAYQHQISSANWWIAQAQARGIEVAVRGRSMLATLDNVGMTTLRVRPVPEIVIPPGCLMYGLETTDRSKLYHAV